MTWSAVGLVFFFFNDTATTEIYTLSLHDALPIYRPGFYQCALPPGAFTHERAGRSEEHTSELQSHSFISYAVFCLKKKTEHVAEGTARTNPQLRLGLSMHISL